MDGTSNFENVTPTIPKRAKHSPLFAILSLVVLCALGIGGIYLFANNDTEAAEKVSTDELDPKRAILTIETICSFGARVSGTKAMEDQQKWLEEKLTAVGGQIEWQEFSVRHPLNGETILLRNLIARFGPATKQRLLVCAHYDTRPYPDMDPRNPKGLFLGANDGASGCAMMVELANAFKSMDLKIGVDLVLFDAEELVYQRGDEYFLGSSHFARKYLTRDENASTYREGILVDMIADKNLELYYEENSLRYAPELTKRIWSIANDLKVKAFVPKLVHDVSDDHIPLNTIAKIPVCDIIDFDYPVRGRRGLNYWHTTEDLPNKCSGQSVCLVAKVLLKWIELEGQKTSP